MTVDPGHVRSSGSLAGSLLALARGARGSKFFRFYAAQLAVARRHVESKIAQTSAEPVVSGDAACLAVDLLPAPLPARPRTLFGVATGRGPRREQRTFVRRAAWLLAEWQLSAMIFLAVGCPNCWAKVPGRHQHLAATDVQSRAFDALVEANLAFSRLSGRTPDPLSR